MSDYSTKCKNSLPIIFDDRMPASNLTPKLVNRVNNNTEDLKNLYEETGDQFTLVKQDINELESDLTVEAGARESADEAINDELATKANIDGSYAEMTVGNADQLTSTVGIEDKVPYLFRTSGGSVDIGDREVDKVVGGTVAWNQIANEMPSTQTISGITFTNNNDGSVSVSGTATADTRLPVVNERPWAYHKFFISGCPKGGAVSTFSLRMRGQGSDAIDVGNGVIWDASGNRWKACVIDIRSGTSISTAVKFKPQITDLTQMFGATIADRAYAMEQSTAGSGIAWLKSMGFFQKDYYPYDAGTLKSVEGLTAHSMVGKNLVSGKLDACYINNVGKITDDTNYAMCYGKVIAGETYTITSDDSAGLVCGFFDSIPTKFADSYNNQRIVQTNKTITAPIDGYIAFRTSAEYANAQLELGSVATAYEPYKTWSYPLDSTLTLRGIPKLDSNNQLYYDGDEYASDGTVKRRFWVHTITSSDQVYGFSTNYDGLHGGSILVPTAYFGKVKGGTNTNGIADKYTVKYANIDKNLYVSGDGQRINIIDDAYTTQEAWFAAIIGTTVVLELVESAYTTEEAEPYQNPQIIDPYGIEAYETTGIVPVGHDTFYPENLRKKIEGLPFNFATLIAPTESTYKATRAYSTGNLFIVNNILYKATTSIASGGTITPGTNCTATTLAEIIAALS